MPQRRNHDIVISSGELIEQSCTIVSRFSVMEPRSMSRTVSSTQSKWALFSAVILLPLAQKCTDRRITLNRWANCSHGNPVKRRSSAIEAGADSRSSTENPEFVRCWGRAA